MLINVIKPFKFAHEGIHVTEYATGEQDVSERCAAVAIAEGWAEAVAKAEAIPDAPPPRKGRKGKAAAGEAAEAAEAAETGAPAEGEGPATPAAEG